MPEPTNPPDAPPTTPPKPKIVTGFHVVELDDGRMDVGFLPGADGKTLLALLGVATMKVHDQIRAFEVEQAEKHAAMAEKDSVINRMMRRLAGEKRAKKAAKMRGEHVAKIQPNQPSGKKPVDFDALAKGEAAAPVEATVSEVGAK